MEGKSVNLKIRHTLCFVICFALIIGTLLLPINSHAATEATEENCTVTVTENIISGSTFVVSAKGDRQEQYNNPNASEGDTAYVASDVIIMPSSYTWGLTGSIMSGAFNGNQDITFTFNKIPQSIAVVVLFDKYKYTEGTWRTATSTHRVEILRTVKGIVRFDANGGSLPAADVTRYYRNDEEFGTLPVPTRKGFVFKGWYYNKPIENTGERITPSTKIMFFHESPWTNTYYAQWKKNVTVKLNPNGGKIKTKNKTKVYGNTYGSLPKPTKKGKVFAGWYTKKNGGTKITSSTLVKSYKTHTVYAHWKNPPVYITKSEYKKIKQGMSYSRVKKIIGGKGDLFDEYIADDKTYREYHWDSKNGFGAYVRFINGKVKPYSDSRGTYYKHTRGI
jgi:uncharacterized repeat protein (TIGR02543 family)